jgi:hypothetical protein
MMVMMMVIGHECEMRTGGQTGGTMERGRGKERILRGKEGQNMLYVYV